jgi:hypothetical protein
MGCPEENSGGWIQPIRSVSPWKWSTEMRGRRLSFAILEKMDEYRPAMRKFYLNKKVQFK